MSLGIYLLFLCKINNYYKQQKTKNEATSQAYSHWRTLEGYHTRSQP